MGHPSDPICMRCGKCCLTDLIAYATEEDRKRWTREGEPIFSISWKKSTACGPEIVSCRRTTATCSKDVPSSLAMEPWGSAPFMRQGPGSAETMCLALRILPALQGSQMFRMTKKVRHSSL